MYVMRKRGRSSKSRIGARRRGMKKKKKKKKSYVSKAIMYRIDSKE